MLCFSAVIHKEAINYVVEVPSAISMQLGNASHIPVRGSADGKPFQSTCARRRGNRYALFLNVEIRKAIGKTAGDSVSVEMEYDPVSRDIPLPEDVEMILAEEHGILEEFLNTSPSYQRELTKYILKAKHENTRLKRIYILVERMRERIAERK